MNGTDNALKHRFRLLGVTGISNRDRIPLLSR
jgi:hypothetical protein